MIIFCSVNNASSLFSKFQQTCGWSSFFRVKHITKQEYKEIMKKGVTALSQRTKLDQRKVDDYAAKYVECIVHRRKKR